MLIDDGLLRLEGQTWRAVEDRAAPVVRVWADPELPAGGGADAVDRRVPVQVELAVGVPGARREVVLGDPEGQGEQAHQVAAEAQHLAHQRCLSAQSLRPDCYHGHGQRYDGSLCHERPENSSRL